jgi:hypothetical protein
MYNTKNTEKWYTNVEPTFDAIIPIFKASFPMSETWSYISPNSVTISYLRAKCPSKQSKKYPTNEVIAEIEYIPVWNRYTEKKVHATEKVVIQLGVHFTLRKKGQTHSAKSMRRLSIGFSR